MKITPYDIIEYLGDRYQGLTGQAPKQLYPITRPMTLEQATRGAITFCRAGNEAIIETSQSEVIIVPSTFTHATLTKWLIVVDDPYACFVAVCNHFFPNMRMAGNNIHPTAILGSVELGQNIDIGAHVVIDHTIIGDNVTIQPGAVIGSDGFGFDHANRGEQGELIRFPHYGNVIIEDDVEIGANAVIDRGTLGSTIIRKGVKIDNLVHVAHNADIGEHTGLVAHSMIAGSVTIGAGSWIAPHAAIRQQQTLGKGVLAGLGAVVVSDVEDGQTVIGVPAKELVSRYEVEYPYIGCLKLPSRIHHILWNQGFTTIRSIQNTFQKGEADRISSFLSLDDYLMLNRILKDRGYVNDVEDGQTVVGVSAKRIKDNP